MIYRRRAVAKQAVLAVVGVVALAAAGLFYLRSSPYSDVPADQFIAFHCTKCGQDFQLSYRELVTRTEKHQFIVAEGRQTFFKCPKCGAVAASRSDEAGDKAKK